MRSQGKAHGQDNLWKGSGDVTALLKDVVADSAAAASAARDKVPVDINIFLDPRAARAAAPSHGARSIKGRAAAAAAAEAVSAAGGAGAGGGGAVIARSPMLAAGRAAAGVGAGGSGGDGRAAADTAAAGNKADDAVTKALQSKVCLLLCVCVCMCVCVCAHVYACV